MIRRKLCRDLEVTRGCHVELILNDPNEFCENPENMIEWIKIAREESEKIAN
jgi:hypothetical protein